MHLRLLLPGMSTAKTWGRYFGNDFSKVFLMQYIRDTWRLLCICGFKRSLSSRKSPCLLSFYLSLLTSSSQLLMASAQKKTGFLTYPETSKVQMPIERAVWPERVVMRDSFWSMVNGLPLEATTPFKSVGLGEWLGGVGWDGEDV